MKRLPRALAIKAHCLDCCGGGRDAKYEVKLCTSVDCFLFPYRLGVLDEKVYTEKKEKTRRTKAKE